MDAIMEEDMWVGDRLPTIYEVALTIFHYSKKSRSNKRQVVIHKYAVSVRNIWIKSFTEKHVMSLTAVKNRINNVMKDYENKVRTGNSSKNKGLHPNVNETKSGCIVLYLNQRQNEENGQNVQMHHCSILVEI